MPPLLLPAILLASGRSLSLPRAVDAAGGFAAWNGATLQSAALARMLERSVGATSVEEALAEVRALLDLGQLLWAYAYMRALHDKDQRLYFATLLAQPELLLPVVYTPTVGEACQKFGLLPLRPRGCYVSLRQAGSVRAALEEYAIATHVPTTGEFLRADGSRGPRYAVDAIVLTDGGRILGLGDLGAWGMGIPLGKLDLYTVCAGFDPARTLPLLLDVGISGPEGNMARLAIGAHSRYTGLRKPRSVGADGLTAGLHGPGGLVAEMRTAAADLFGPHVLLQFEDFQSADAFALLACSREVCLSYNDDIQGTAAVSVAGILGALRMRAPHATAAELRALLRCQRFLFHGAGSANLGAASLLVSQGGVPREQVWLTNSKGLLWADAAGGPEGNFRSEEQRALAQRLSVGATAEPGGSPSAAGVRGLGVEGLVEAHRPHFLIGAVGRQPGAFGREVVEGMVRANSPERPTIFALSNPSSQAELSAADAYAWSGGAAIFGSGTACEPVQVGGATRQPGQVNNVYCFPGISFGAVACRAARLPDEIFFAAAEAVAGALTAQELAEGRVVPHAARIREVGLEVATAVVLRAQELGLAGKTLGAGAAEVRAALAAQMWEPSKAALT